MDIIILKKPTIEYADDIMRFRQEIIDANDPDAFAGCDALETVETLGDPVSVSKVLAESGSPLLAALSVQAGDPETLAKETTAVRELADSLISAMPQQTTITASEENGETSSSVTATEVVESTEQVFSSASQQETAPAASQSEQTETQKTDQIATEGNVASAETTLSGNSQNDAKTVENQSAGTQTAVNVAQNTSAETQSAEKVTQGSSIETKSSEKAIQSSSAETQGTENTTQSSAAETQSTENVNQSSSTGTKSTEIVSQSSSAGTQNSSTEAQNTAQQYVSDSQSTEIATQSTNAEAQTIASNNTETQNVPDSVQNSDGNSKTLEGRWSYGQNNSTGVNFWSKTDNVITGSEMTITETKQYEDGITVLIVDQISNFSEENFGDSVPTSRTITTTDADGNSTTETYGWAQRDDGRYMVVDQNGQEVVGADPTSTGASGQEQPEESRVIGELDIYSPDGDHVISQGMFQDPVLNGSDEGNGNGEP